MFNILRTMIRPVLARRRKTATKDQPPGLSRNELQDIFKEDLSAMTKRATIRKGTGKAGRPVALPADFHRKPIRVFAAE